MLPLLSTVRVVIKNTCWMDEASEHGREADMDFLHIPFVIFVAWITLKYFDDPVCAWLTRRYGIKRSPSIKPVIT
jgi:hypothetical protein